MQRSRSIHGGEVEGDFDDERERAMAALLLSSLKYEIFDPPTAKALEDMKKKFRRRAKNKKTNTVINNNNNNNIVVNQTLTAIEDYNPPDIPPVPKLHGIVGRCSKPFEKQLTSSDVRDDQSRLTMSKRDVKACLLPLMNGHNLECGIPVRLYDRDGDEYSVTFKCWGGKIHVLTGTGWKHFYKKYLLKELEHFVTIWMFYHASTSDICFAVTCRELPVTKA